jgi:hypothetical protein
VALTTGQEDTRMITGVITDTTTDMIMAEAIADKITVNQTRPNNPLRKPERIIYFYKTVWI